VSDFVSDEQCALTWIINRFAPYGAALVVEQRPRAFERRISSRKPKEFETESPDRRLD
jgi:hypothetical protein